jgi:hypothetical protein
MLRDNLAGLIEPMVNRAGAHPLGGHHKAGPNGGCSRSTGLASVALKRSWPQIVRWKTGRRSEKAKWPGFEVTTAAHNSRAVGTAWHQSHRTIDPQCLKKSPPRRGGIYALTKNVAFHFTLNQDRTIWGRLLRRGWDHTGLYTAFVKFCNRAGTKSDRKERQKGFSGFERVRVTRTSANHSVGPTGYPSANSFVCKKKLVRCELNSCEQNSARFGFWRNSQRDSSTRDR